MRIYNIIDITNFVSKLFWEIKNPVRNLKYIFNQSKSHYKMRYKILNYPIYPILLYLYYLISANKKKKMIVLKVQM